MALIKLKPTSAGRRHYVKVVTTELHKGKPVAGLIERKSRKAGRNNYGHVTTRHHGGGHKQHYRIVDFRRDKDGIPAKVAGIEYDPNRTARIALLHYADGEKRYILAPVGVAVGDTLLSGEAVDIRPGNTLPIRAIPLGTVIHNVEAQPGSGGKMIRSAGSFGQLMAKENGYAQIRMPSGEVRRVSELCKATVGQLSNVESSSVRVGKAGKSRWLGIRPTVRGLAMNPVDHPHGGGEGKSGQGNPHPVSPWGQKTKGLKTRNNRRTDKLIVTRRKPGVRNTPH